MANRRRRGVFCTRRSVSDQAALRCGRLGRRRAIGRNAAAAGRGEAVEVGLPQRVAVAAEVVQQIPGIQAAVVTVGKNQTKRVIANRFDALDCDVALAQLQGFLTAPVAAHGRRRREYAEKLMAEFIARVLIDKFKAAGFLMQPDFSGNRRIGRKSGHSEYQSVEPGGEGGGKRNGRE